MSGISSLRRNLRRSWAPLGTALLLAVQQVAIMKMDPHPRGDFHLYRPGAPSEGSLISPAPAAFRPERADPAGDRR